MEEALITVLKLDLTLPEVAIAISVILIVASLQFLHYRRLKKNFTQSSDKQLLEEKKLLEQLFNNMPDRIYFKDRNSKFILANKHVSLIMGEQDPAKLIGKSDFDFYEKKYAKGYFEDEQRIMDLGTPMISKEEKGLDLDGNEIFVSTTKIPIKNENNKVIGIIGIGRDITPQKTAEKALHEKSESLKETNVLLEERQEEIQQMAEELNAQAENLKAINVELERLSLVASNTDNSVIIMDGNGNFEWVNKAFVERYGMNLETFKKEKGVNLRDSSSNDNISAVLNQIYINQKPYSYTSRTIDAKGKEIWTQSNISPILNSKKEIVNLVLIDSDISELKLAEHRIKKQNSEIEQQSVELKRINATKDRLFSIIAHDLKNPFHSILGFTDIIRKKYKDIDREKLNELLELISTSATSAYQLLENLLDWARTQTDNVSFKPKQFNLSEIVDEIISLQSLQASNKNITLNNELGKSYEAFADRNMLNTTIRNLTSNAIKYTPEGGTVTINAEQSESTVTIYVIDNGVGMEKEKLDDLFDLDKLKSTAGTKGESGTGLGLIVCYEFIKRNNGTIGVESKPGKGTTFSITIPNKEF